MTLRKVSLLDTHWVQLGRGLKFSILTSHLGARMLQITQRIQTKSHCPFRQWLPFSVISLKPSSGTAMIPTKTSERGVERWRTTKQTKTVSGLNQTSTKFHIDIVDQIQDLIIWSLSWVGIWFNWLHLKDWKLIFTEMQLKEMRIIISDIIFVWLEKNVFSTLTSDLYFAIQYHKNVTYEI